MSYETGSRWLDGPRFVAWLDSLERPLPASLTRRMREWRLGGVADFYGVEHYLCALGFHASEIPDECWSDVAPDRGKWARVGAR